MAGRGPTIQIPRWIQLVVLPVLLVLAFLLAAKLGHVLFLFLTASVIAFTLNPLVRDLTRLRVPRGTGAWEGELTHTTGLHVPVDAGVAAAFLR